MNLCIPNARYGVVLPGGQYAVLRWPGNAAPEAIQTHAGDVDLPHTEAAVEGVLYLDGRMVGGIFEFGGQGKESGEAWVFRSTEWRPFGTTYGVWPVLFTDDAVLVWNTHDERSRNGRDYRRVPDVGAASEVPSGIETGQGFRFVKPDGTIVFGDHSLQDPARGLCEFTDYGDVAIGQGVEGGMVVRFADDGVLRVLASGRCLMPKVHRAGDTFGIAFHQPDTVEMVLRVMTSDELRALPALTNAVPALPVGVGPLPRHVRWGYYQPWTETGEPGGAWSDYDPREWPCDFGTVETAHQLQVANAINFPVLAAPTEGDKNPGVELARHVRNLVGIRLGRERFAASHDELIAQWRPLSVQLDRPLVIYIDGDPRDQEKHPWPTLIRPGDVVHFPLYAELTDTPATLIERGLSIASWLRTSRGMTHGLLASMAFDRTWVWPPNALANFQSVPAAVIAHANGFLIGDCRFSLGREGIKDGRRIGGTGLHETEFRPWHEAQVAATPAGADPFPRPSQFTVSIPVPPKPPANPPAPPPPTPPGVPPFFPFPKEPSAMSENDDIEYLATVIRAAGMNAQQYSLIELRQQARSLRDRFAQAGMKRKPVEFEAVHAFDVWTAGRTGRVNPEKPNEELIVAPRSQAAADEIVLFVKAQGE